ncbi:MAG: tRNA uridine-5-carboxymethylaminomethyl(34) synthesis enzyme MnmG, partial [Gammaproteobacteria bacterium HGW-Gammaproteobacteria-6]
HGLWATPGNALGAALQRTLDLVISRETRVLDLLKRPELGYAHLMQLAELGPGSADPLVAEQVEISVKYSGYLNRQREEIDRQQRHEETGIPDDFDYCSVTGLSTEVRQKLIATTPATVGQASRIAGVTPASISLLLVHLLRQQRRDVA